MKYEYSFPSIYSHRTGNFSYNIQNISMPFDLD